LELEKKLIDSKQINTNNYLSFIITFFLVLIGYFQFDSIQTQNSLIENQNSAIENQNNVIESERRSSVMILFNNLLDKIDETIKEQRKEANRETNFTINPELINRIISVSKGLRPYRRIHKDSIHNDLVSSERGILLISLFRNNLLDEKSRLEIALNSNFSCAEVNGNIELKGINLNNVLLDKAFFRGTQLQGAKFKKCKLTKTDFTNAKLQEADFSNAFLIGTNFTNATIENADFTNADFSNCHISYNQLIKSKSLKGCKNLNTEILNKIKKEFPTLLDK